MGWRVCGVGVFELKNAAYAGDVDAGGDQGGDAGDLGEVLGAVATGTALVRAGVSRPRRSHNRIDWMGAPDSSAATEIP